MANQGYTPGTQNAPFGITKANPQGSFYASESATVFNATETNLLRKAIRERIFDAAPQQYNALKLVFSRSPKTVASDEFEYLEKTFGRNPLTANAISALVAAVAGTQVTQVITLTAASMDYVTPDMVITYPNNDEGVIKSINAGANQITVGSLTSAGLPAVASGDVFAFRSTIEGDGQDFFAHYSRLETITRYNYVQQFLRAQRWDKWEYQKYVNTGTTDYLENDKEEKLKQLRTDLFVSYFNGHRGEYSTSASYAAKSMGGIYPTMVNAGSLTSNPTTAGLKAAFEALAFASNYKVEGGTRFIYGSQEMLYKFSEIYKQPGLRYTPNDSVAKLDLQMIEFGGMKFVLVPCELFREPSCFPADWANKIIVLDQESVKPVIMEGIPAMNMGSTLDRGQSGTRENYKDWYVEAQLSLEFDNPLGSFWMDVQP